MTKSSSDIFMNRAAAAAPRTAHLARLQLCFLSKEHLQVPGHSTTGRDETHHLRQGRLLDLPVQNK